MDNYKIKVKDEAESKVAQELMFQLGGTWHDLKTDIREIPYVEKYLFLKDGLVTYGGWESYSYHCGQELTLPQLRDLVVLKRNDVKDANYTYCGKPVLGLDTQDYKVWNNLDKCWATHLGSDTDLRNGLKPIAQTQDPALISGAEAHKALLAGENVQYSGYGEQDWDTALNCNIGVFLNHEKFPDFSFRIVPRTIKVNSELPKPQKETQHNSLVYAVTYEFKTREERNAFADKLRGTNS
ncbi:hypothetical protein [Acinetobacter sp. GN11]